MIVSKHPYAIVVRTADHTWCLHPRLTINLKKRNITEKHFSQEKKTVPRKEMVSGLCFFFCYLHCDWLVGEHANDDLGCLSDSECRAEVRGDGAHMKRAGDANHFEKTVAQRRSTKRLQRREEEMEPSAKAFVLLCLFVFCSSLLLPSLLFTILSFSFRYSLLFRSLSFLFLLTDGSSRGPHRSAPPAYDVTFITMMPSIPAGTSTTFPST